MRFSLRTLLILLTLAAIDLAVWQINVTWGYEFTCVLVAVLVVWAIGPRRMKTLEPPVATERWLRRFGKRKNGD